MKVGDYEPRICKKGEEETDLMNDEVNPIKEGDVFWVVMMERNCMFDVKEQKDAEIISRLIKIEKMIRSLYKFGNNGD